MRIVIEEDIVKDLGLDLPEAILLAFSQTKANYERTIESLRLKKLLVRVIKEGTKDQTYLANSETAKKILDNIYLNSENYDGKMKIDLKILVKKLQECYPQGKKYCGNSSYYWRGNSHEIIISLKRFFRSFGTNYTPEQMIEATKQYVDNFNQNNQLMQLLKYFIIKDGNSELLSYLEHSKEENNSNNITGDDWTVKLN